MVIVIETENKQEEVELKEFNLEKALNGAKVFTRNGRQVTELHQFKTLDGVYTLVGVIDGKLYAWDENGVWDRTGKTTNDLFIVPKVIRKYQNVYYNPKENEMWVGGQLHNTEKAAVNAIGQNEYYIKTIEITHEID